MTTKSSVSEGLLQASSGVYALESSLSSAAGPLHIVKLTYMFCWVTWREAG